VAERRVTRRSLAIAVTIGAACAAYWLLLPWVPERAARAASILIVAAGFWGDQHRHGGAGQQAVCHASEQ